VELVLLADIRKEKASFETGFICARENGWDEEGWVRKS
jgi:hypothetical protein